MTTKMQFKERTSKALANHLWSTLERLENGDINHQHARAVTATAACMLGVARLEMDHARFVTDMRGMSGGSGSLPTLPMGS